MGALPDNEIVPPAISIEDRLRLVINTIPCLILRATPDGAFDFINQQWLEFTGLKMEEVKGQGWRTALHPEDVRRVMTTWRAGLAAGEPFENEARVRRVDGEYRWFLIRNVPLRDFRGRIVQWYGTGHDIDELKGAEDRLRLVIDTTPALLHSALPNGDIDFFNQRMLDYLGAPLEELCGWRWTNFIHPDDVEQIVSKWRWSLDTGEPFGSEARVRRADGEFCWQLHRKVPLRDQAGNIVKWFGSSIDIDDRKRADDALRKSYDEIKALKDQLYKENLALKQEIDQTSMFEEIVGSSEKLRRVLVLVAKVAPTDSTVLITGETGTGKELVARAIHKRSPRAARAFVSLNCAAIPLSLVAAELFGYEKGAFTGATHRRLGRFELADGGTLFLDEVGELSLEIQITLLRVLQERTFERVGGSQPITVNVRVVAATNRDLRAAVEAGTFRQDLFYRLNVFPIHVPALRERVDDIPLLLEYLTERYASKVGKRIGSVRKKTMDLFQAYDWPGNIRELQNVVERAVILCDGDTLEVDEAWLQRESPKAAVATRGLGRPNEKQEKEIIECALRECQGRVSGPLGAAAKLGLPRSTLESRIRILRINKHHFKSN
ncbi:MAG TPA: sigma-54-dependent Fis family transcriptional regulator [Candidatus Sulfotelmatobacter sp.]|jgi:formate hydrogenlyase transcriptional activator|nr:sigma-54-dependent Fis family transcriptional regulator [Candidatus Sulfotelmatobacter sp.]